MSLPTTALGEVLCSVADELRALCRTVIQGSGGQNGEACVAAVFCRQEAGEWVLGYCC